MSNKLVVLAILLLPLQLISKNLPPVPAPWTDSIQFQMVRFFEKGKAEVAYGDRVYADTFSRAATRYVAWELHLTYPPPEETKSFEITVVFWGPEGKETGRIDHKAYAAAGQGQSFHYQGWGWPDPGYWLPGSYRVTFSLGDRLLGEGKFFIQNSGTEGSGEEWLREVRLDFIRFYEKGTETVPYEQRQYRKSFTIRSTRYVAWELHLRHPVAKQPVNFELQSIYYLPDGRVFGRSGVQTSVSADWKSSWHTAGWGWPDPGFWQRGIYKVEFYLEKQLLATDFFELK